MEICILYKAEKVKKKEKMVNKKNLRVRMICNYFKELEKKRNPAYFMGHINFVPKQEKTSVRESRTISLLIIDQRS
jgi:hypothetical protein